MTKERSGRDERAIDWRYLAPPPPPPDPFAGEDELDRAWLQLQLAHTSFRATAQDEYQALTRALAAIQQLFLEREELARYYEESHQRPGQPEPTSATVHLPRVRHVIALQAQLMEDAYFVLQLRRYANAPDNRGWMNLFRSWGQSPAFNLELDERLSPTFSAEFVEFYDLYVREYPGPIETHPVPHPWETRDWPLPNDSRGARRQRLEGTGGWLPGVFLDSGVREIRVGPISGEAPLEGPSGAHGVADAKGTTPPASSDGDASGGGGRAPDVPNK